LHFFLCMHDSGHTHQGPAGQTQDFEDAGMHWAPALGTCAAHAFAHARLAGVSREPTRARRVHTTLLIRSELPGGIGIAYRRPCHLGIYEGQETLAHHRPLAVTTRLWYRTSLSIDCKYGLHSNIYMEVWLT
jgi:hypothetical protein